ncbi:hypothetical protein WM41_2425 [Corynebacterium simulans]|uniref:Uncharacterized protein n=1 Tax=Corynebacterium simulans TaxID=146827 RepID=A0ABR5V632_9CORY|nr:hypothetical protein WM41_2425 [Corynebacterium simulans]
MPLPVFLDAGLHGVFVGHACDLVGHFPRVLFYCFAVVAVGAWAVRTTAIRVD